MRNVIITVFTLLFAVACVAKTTVSEITPVETPAVETPAVEAPTADHAEHADDGAERQEGVSFYGRSGEAIHAAIAARYQGSRFVSVRDLNDTAELERGAFMRPDTLNNTNNLELSVYANDDAGQAWLCARLDNLGKGASGAAVQNMNLALGLAEDAGL